MSYNTWGSSWGVSWGVSWGSGNTPPIGPRVDGGFYGHKRKAKSGPARWEIEAQDETAFTEKLSYIYDRIHGLLPEEKVEIEAAVKAHSSTTKTTQKKARVPVLDIESMQRDMQAVRAIYEAHQRLMDEEEMMFLMMMAV